MSDPNVEAVRRKLEERSAVGIAKYGTTTARDDLTLREWLVHLQEELMDAAVYIEAALSQPTPTLAQFTRATSAATHNHLCASRYRHRDGRPYTCNCGGAQAREDTPAAVDALRVDHAMVDAGAKALAELIGGHPEHWVQYRNESRACLAAALAAPHPPEAAPHEGDEAVQRFRKRPVVIDAMLFDGTAEAASVIARWANAGDAPDDDPTVSYLVSDAEPGRAFDMVIQTLEGGMSASVGDWIIRGVKGEFYACKPDVFALTYETKATPPAAQASDTGRGEAIPNAEEGDFDCPRAAAARACPCGFCRALTHPAMQASEGADSARPAFQRGDRVMRQNEHGARWPVTIRRAETRWSNGVGYVYYDVKDDDGTKRCGVPANELRAPDELDLRAAARATQEPRRDL
jgi:hypothetical protein